MSEGKCLIEEAFLGVKAILLPDDDVINQLLKLSETDKEKALRHLVSLFKSVSDDGNIITNKYAFKLCKYFVYCHLSKPNLVYDPKDNHRLVTREEKNLEDCENGLTTSTCKK